MIKKLSLPFYIKLTCTLISIVILGYLAKIGDTILVPFIFGLLLAMLLTPVSDFLERKLRFSRTIAGIFTVFVFFGLVAFGFFMLAAQLSMIKDDLPAFQEQFLDSFHLLQTWVTDRFGIVHSEQIALLNKTAAQTFDSGTVLLGSALLSLSSVLILLVFTFLYTIFLLIYRRHMVRFLLMLMDAKHQTIVIDIVGQVQYVVKKYLIGLLLQMLIVFALVFGALSVVGVKYSLLLAIITAVFNVLPYIGIFISVLIIALLTFATSSFTHAIVVVLVLSLIHMIDSNYIVPKIVGSKVKVNSLFAMMAIIFGKLLWGFSGMFLAIPILAICKIVMDRVQELKPWGFLLGEEEVVKIHTRAETLTGEDLNFEADIDKDQKEES